MRKRLLELEGQDRTPPEPPVVQRAEVDYDWMDDPWDGGPVSVTNSEYPQLTDNDCVMLALRLKGDNSGEYFLSGINCNRNMKITRRRVFYTHKPLRKEYSNWNRNRLQFSMQFVSFSQMYD